MVSKWAAGEAADARAKLQSQLSCSASNGSTRVIGRVGVVELIDLLLAIVYAKSDASLSTVRGYSEAYHSLRALLAVASLSPAY